MSGKRRSPKVVQEVRQAAREILAAHHPMTLRQVHYALVSRGDLDHPNTTSAYKVLGGWLRDDRLQGLIPWEWMVDRLRGVRDYAGWQDPPAWAQEVQGSYRLDVWASQPLYVECWLEKDALSGVFSSILAPYRVPLNVGRGYDGWTSIKQAADRYMLSEVPVVVLYAGDFDPSGVDMYRNLPQSLARLGVHPQMPMVALTPEDAHRLMASAGTEVKAKDSRAKKFRALHGDTAVELDALPVEELRTMLEGAIEGLMDMEALAATLEQEEEQRAWIRDRMGRVFPADGLDH